MYRFGAVVPVAAPLQVAGGGVDGVRVALLQDRLLGHGALYAGAQFNTLSVTYIFQKSHRC